VSERCIVRIRFTPAGGESTVRRAVGGFLRYVQHRDLHPRPSEPSVAGLVKYVAYRDRASARAELFGSHGLQSTVGRKAFVEFVARSIAESAPQQFRTRDGRLLDRRRAVSRLIISPERSQGLDLERLTRAAMTGLAEESSSSDLRWIAAIHRNTAHHHVHLVVAGMHEDARGRFYRLDITRPRLAAIKQAVALEIERQRREWMPSRTAKVAEVTAAEIASRAVSRSPVALPRVIPIPRLAQAFHRNPLLAKARPMHGSSYRISVLRLRAAARLYQRQVERDAEQEARIRHWDLAA